MEDDTSSLQERIKRNDLEMEVIRIIAVALYLNPDRFSSSALKRCEEMKDAMLTWGCRTSYHYVIAAAVQYFVSRGFFAVPFLRDVGALESPREETPPRIHFNWIHAVSGNETYLFYANYRLQLNPFQPYMLHFDSDYSEPDESGYVLIHLWPYDKMHIEEDASAVVFIKMSIAGKLTREDLCMMLASYIEIQFDSVFNKKVAIALLNHEKLLNPTGSESDDSGNKGDASE